MNFVCAHMFLFSDSFILSRTKIVLSCCLGLKQRKICYIMVCFTPLNFYFIYFLVQVTLVGMVFEKAERNTDVNFVLDDGTGRIKCRRWYFSCMLNAMLIIYMTLVKFGLAFYL